MDNNIQFYDINPKMTAYTKPIGCQDNQTSIRANLASNDTAEEKEINGILGKLKFFFLGGKI